ncbi:Ras-related protein Rab-5B like protein [Argiope bruennichi]|uniref:Ras-related protein Rab-5B like protein n=1 Tax=Argiope bruennichi TaxID=94029 RepID=A0A8T0FIF9_ARGBR|nr:Ras-related protein Rab-5B like protein [Argiope bruennichi]
MSSSLSVKTCVIGSQGVGKTSMIFQLSMKQFKTNVTPTIGASFSCKVIDIDSYTIRFQIWDTAGQETYKSMLPMYYRKANLAIVVFDITCYESFANLPKWIEELQRNADNDCIICIVGNKLDLEHRRVVDGNKAAQFAKSIGALYFETSAKTNEGIMDVFIHVARQMINSYKRQKSSTGSQNPPVKLEMASKENESHCCS